MNLEDLQQVAELRPFIPAIKELRQRMEGIELYREPLAFQLANSYQREEQLYLDLMKQKIFAFQVSNERNEHWDILKESFNQFASRSTELIFAAKGASSDRLQAINQWLIDLCDWGQTGFSNITRH
ncbi:hypothetical protein ABC502_14125 [Alkalimonas sp. NCh-2]|uniref:hypothetical protein n=1 Tax=Alkalimonas sp. NCh-2 TaxID=3144846 RepID=UPI0031F5FAE8